SGGRRRGRETNGASAAPPGAPSEPPVRPASAGVPARSRPGRGHRRCGRPAGAVLAAARRPPPPAARATGAAKADSLVQFLDPVFDVPALAVHPFINPAGALGQVGDNESRVVFGLLAGLPNHFGFDDDAAAVRPPSVSP